MTVLGGCLHFVLSRVMTLSKILDMNLSGSYKKGALDGVLTSGKELKKELIYLGQLAEIKYEARNTP